jgi:hypothetical protein
MESSNVFDPVVATVSQAVVLATAQRAIGAVIVALLFISGVAVFWFNTRKARPELGAEIELAPNRKRYYDDEELEGRVLDRVLGIALILIAIIAVGLPLYWLAEPGRQEGAAIAYNGDPDDPEDMGIFAARGEALFQQYGCGDCHGGVEGGRRDHILLDPETGEFAAQVQWKAPALNTVTLRYSREEIEYVLNYGRPGTPMQAFGQAGGGALTRQQIANLIDYLYFVSISEEEAKEQATAEIERSLEAGECSTSASTATSPAAPTRAGAATPPAGRTVSRSSPAAAAPSASRCATASPRTGSRPSSSTTTSCSRGRSRVRATAASARAAVECPGSAACSPRNRSEQSSSTSGGCR